MKASPLSVEAALEETLRKKGNYRLTKQRRQIVRILEDNEGHLSAEQIYKKAKKRNKNLGIATVYRTLSLLEKLKLVKKLEAGSKVLYELDVQTPNHSHFICQGCGKIVEMKEIELSECEKMFLGEKENYQLTDCSIRLYGYCPECKKKLIKGDVK